MYKWVIAVLLWLPGAMRWAEEHYGPGAGPEKRDDVIKWLSARIPASLWEGASAFFEGVGLIIDGLVLVFNSLGIFKKGGDA